MHLGVETWFDITCSCEDCVTSVETEIFFSCERAFVICNVLPDNPLNSLDKLLSKEKTAR